VRRHNYSQLSSTMGKNNNAAQPPL